jgi:hypothetical protein
MRHPIAAGTKEALIEHISKIFFTLQVACAAKLF